MVYYYKDDNSYDLETCISNHSERWKEIFMNVLKLKLAILANRNSRMKLKEADVYGFTLDVVKEALLVFDKFLINIEGYYKHPIIDEVDGSDITLEQDIDYKVILKPFDGFFDKMEVK